MMAIVSNNNELFMPWRNRFVSSDSIDKANDIRGY